MERGLADAVGREALLNKDVGGAWLLLEKALVVSVEETIVAVISTGFCE